MMTCRLGGSGHLPSRLARWQHAKRPLPPDAASIDDSHKRRIPHAQEDVWEIDTCGEAYYRYATCGDLSLDARPLGAKVPPPEGQPIGIPCEQQLHSGPGCGKTSAFSARGRRWTMC